MKKSYIVLAAVPILAALGGFGAGQFLHDGSAPPHATEHAEGHGPAQDIIPAPRSMAEKVLHSLAEQEAHATEDTRHSSLSIKERLMPASLHTQGVEQPAVTADLHKIDLTKVHEYEQKVALETKREEARKAQEARVDQMREKKPMAVRTAHPSLLPVETEAKIAEGAIKRIEETDDHVVRLGRLTVPVYNAASITYFVADFGVSVTDLEQASHYYNAENAARLRDQVVTTMHTVAETQLLRGPVVDSDQVAQRVAEDLRREFFGIEDFIFLSLYKTDVPRG